MASTTHNPSILLKRILSLTESSRLIACLDTVAQTSAYLVREMVSTARNSNKNLNVIYVSFETVNQPAFATHFIDASSRKVSEVSQTINSYLPSLQQPTSSKYLVIIDSLNYLPSHQVAQFFASFVSPYATVVTTLHTDIPEHTVSECQHYPSLSHLLQFMATTILEVHPVLPEGIDQDQLKRQLSSFSIPNGLNEPIFELSLTVKRKSGRTLQYSFHVDTNNHVYELVMDESNDKNEVETSEMLQDLATFNLTTSAKQKEAKEQVALPFLEAQRFNSGGAIVYEYQEDDDYDEEDPYEDPF